MEELDPASEVSYLLFELQCEDAASAVFGLCVDWIVHVAEGAQVFAPVTAIWLFALPLMDTTYVMVRRGRLGEPIFGSDRRHLHHLFLRSGFTYGRIRASCTSSAMTRRFRPSAWTKRHGGQHPSCRTT